MAEKPRRPLLARPEGAPDPLKELLATDSAVSESRRQKIQEWLAEAQAQVEQEKAQAAAQNEAAIRELRERAGLDPQVEALLDEDDPEILED